MLRKILGIKATSTTNMSTNIITTTADWENYSVMSDTNNQNKWSITGQTICPLHISLYITPSGSPR